MDVSVVVVVGCVSSCISCAAAVAAAVAAAAVVSSWRHRLGPSKVRYTLIFRSHTEPYLVVLSHPTWHVPLWVRLSTLWTLI